VFDPTEINEEPEAKTVRPNPDISPTPVEARTALPFECSFIEVSNLDERAGNAEAKL
jgi:hypothetical protein